MAAREWNCEMFHEVCVRESERWDRQEANEVERFACQLKLNCGCMNPEKEDKSRTETGFAVG